MKKLISIIFMPLLIFIFADIVLGYICNPADPICGPIPTDACNVVQNLTLIPGTYNLPSGIDICGFNITNNIMLDCNGATLNGSSLYGPGSIGIRNIDTNGTIIKNCNVVKYNNGIFVSHYNNLITNNTLFLNSNVGLGIASHNSTFINNNVSSNYQYGIRIVSNYSKIIRNIISSNINNGLDVEGNYNIFIDNEISYNGESGIYLQYSNLNNFSNNSMYGNRYNLNPSTSYFSLNKIGRAHV